MPAAVELLTVLPLLFPVGLMPVVRVDGGVGGR